MSDVTITYNGTLIDPPPVLTSLQQQSQKTAAGEVIGCLDSLTFKGFQYVQLENGTTELLDSIQAYKELFSCTGELQILCDTGVIFSQCVRPVSFEVGESNNQFVKSYDYTVTFEGQNLEGCCDEGLTSKVDTWSVETDETCNYFDIAGVLSPLRTFNVTHNVSATALDRCDGTYGWEIAKAAVQELLEIDIEVIQDSVIGNACLSSYAVFNRVRRIEIDKTAGSYTATEVFVLCEQNTGIYDNIREEFNVDITKERNSRTASVSINGTIDGYETSNFDSGCYTIQENKYESALAYLSYVTGELHTRAQNISGLTLSPYPTNYTIGHSPRTGQIRYAYGFDNNTTCFSQVSDCAVLQESVTISHNRPADVYAEHQVIGRPCPILQELGIKTKGVKTINIDLILDCGDPCGDYIAALIDTGITAQSDSIVQDVYSHLTGNYYSVYTDNDTENWDPKTGSYSRNVVFSYTDCCTGI